MRQNEAYTARDLKTSQYIAELEQRVEGCHAEPRISADVHSLTSDAMGDKAEATVQPPTAQTLSMAEGTRERIWRTVERRVSEGAFANPNLTRDSFADEVACNHTYLSQVIKDKTGMTFQQYLNHVRISEAIRLLSSPEDPGPMKEVANAVGFLSVSSFYPVFKARTGISPAQYRKTYLSLESRKTEPAVAE